MNKPLKEIDLSDNDKKIIQAAKNTLGYADVSIESLFSLFNEWQSSKTKSLKRFVLSFSFILFMSLVAGVNITDIDLFGVTVHEGREAIFLIILALILIITFAYYEYLRQYDLKIHDGQIKSLSETLDNCLEEIIKLNEIVEKNSGIASVEVLLRDFEGIHDKGNYLMTYEAIKFYEEELQKPKKSRDIIERAEIIIIYFLGLSGMGAIIYSFPVDTFIEIVTIFE